MKRAIFVTLMSTAICCTAPSSFGVNNGAPPAENDTRFDAIAAFSESSALFDLPPGAAGDYWGNGTLIDSTHMLMARHIAPENLPPNDVTIAEEGKYAFRFRRRVDGGLGTAEQGWESFFHVTVHSFRTFDVGTDMVIAELDTAVTHIHPIAIDAELQVTANMTLILAGWGKEGPCWDEGPKRRLNLVNATCTGYDCGIINWESGPVNIFDSGGAILYETPASRIRLVGVIDWLFGGTDARLALDPPYDPGCTPASYAVEGAQCADFNDDGHTDINDLLWVITHWGPCPPEVHCRDIDGDDAIGIAELLSVINAWGVECPIQLPCPFDLNGDGVVDSADLQIVINHSNIPCCSIHCPWDFDGDGDVDEADQDILKENYGECP